MAEESKPTLAPTYKKEEHQRWGPLRLEIRNIFSITKNLLIKENQALRDFPKNMFRAYEINERIKEISLQAEVNKVFPNEYDPEFPLLLEEYKRPEYRNSVRLYEGLMRNGWLAKENKNMKKRCEEQIHILVDQVISNPNSRKLLKPSNDAYASVMIDLGFSKNRNQPYDLKPKWRLLPEFLQLCNRLVYAENDETFEKIITEKDPDSMDLLIMGSHKFTRKSLADILKKEFNYDYEKKNRKSAPAPPPKPIPANATPSPGTRLRSGARGGVQTRTRSGQQQSIEIFGNHNRYDSTKRWRTTRGVITSRRRNPTTNTIRGLRLIEKFSNGGNPTGGADSNEEFWC